MYSNFNGIRCLEAWNCAPEFLVTPSCDVIEMIPTQHEDEDPEHILIILQFDSTLPENTKPPFGRGQDAKENYEFTAKQHALAGPAKTVKSVDELEKAV
jgi:hypothetical protein